MLRHFFHKPYEALNHVYLSKAALLHNLQLFRDLNPGKEVCPVLKGNAYGHGMKEIADLLDDQGCSYFVVDSLFEAYELKKMKIRTKILVLGYNFAHNLRKGLPFEFAASDLTSLKALIKYKLPFHLEIDTGMKRMGLSEMEVKEALPFLQGHSDLFKGLFTHFMTADSADLKHFELQQDCFRRVLDLLGDLRPQWIHLGNSAGAQKTTVPEENMVRIGLGLYGINPYSPDEPNFHKLEALQPVMKVESTLITVREVEAGEAVSYGATFVAECSMRIGIIPFGYFEGLDRGLSNKGFVNIAGKRCPIVGRVNMNHTFIDVSAVETKLGDKVELYPDLRAAAVLAETIPYEILTRLSPSVRRTVVATPPIA
jgi:alanine racemase